MEKEQNINSEVESSDVEENKINDLNDTKETDSSENNEEIKEITPEEKICELEEKITRTFAEMENQRRRFEKEREDAFNYGGFAFAKETLNLIDNLELIITKSNKTNVMTIGIKRYNFPKLSLLIIRSISISIR